MKPMQGCALFGATRAVTGIKDAFILQHSVVGCQWGTVNFQTRINPLQVHQASTVVYEENVILGGDQLLVKALKESEELYPNFPLTIVISGCVPNMIGDDVEGVLKETDYSKRVLHLNAPGYAANEAEARNMALAKLFELVKPPKERLSRSINIIGLAYDDPYSLNDLAYLKKLLAPEVKINCALHNCTVQQLEGLAEAELNIVFGYGQGLAQKLEKSYGQSYVELPYPYGVQGLIDFLVRIGKELKVDFSSKIKAIEEEATELVEKSAAYLANIYQLPVAIVGDRAHLPGLESFVVNELGMELVLALDTNEGDQQELERQLEEKQPVLLWGSSFEAKLARDRQLPLVRYGYPVFDEICLGKQTLLGAEGTAYLLEKIINTALQQSYKEDGTCAGLNKGETRP